MEYNLPVIMTVRMSAFLSDRMVGVVTAFSLFCSTMSPTKYSSLSTLSLCVCVCVCMCVYVCGRGGQVVTTKQPHTSVHDMCTAVRL